MEPEIHNLSISWLFTAGENSININKFSLNFWEAGLVCVYVCVMYVSIVCVCV